MSIGEWVEENPVKSTLIGGTAAAVALASRGRLSELAFGLAQDVVKAGSIDVGAGLTAERIGNNMRLTAKDSALAFDVTKTPLGGYHVTAKLPDRSAYLNFLKNGATIRTEDGWAKVNSYNLRAKFDGSDGVVKEGLGYYDKPTIDSETMRVTDRNIEGKNWSLGVGQISGPGDPVEYWNGSFGGHRLEGLFKNGLIMGTSDGDRVHSVFTAITRDGIRTGTQNEAGSLMSWSDLAKQFEHKYSRI